MCAYVCLVRLYIEGRSREERERRRRGEFASRRAHTRCREGDKAGEKRLAQKVECVRLVATLIRGGPPLSIIYPRERAGPLETFQRARVAMRPGGSPFFSLFTTHAYVRIYWARAQRLMAFSPNGEGPWESGSRLFSGPLSIGASLRIFGKAVSETCRPDGGGTVLYRTLRRTGA